MEGATVPQLLTPGVYGEEFRAITGPFGLRCGQMRGRDIAHNGGWYNRQGQKVGWGDLSPDDLRRIKDELPQGELFIVLSEHKSHWDLPTNLDARAPGVGYVAENCRFVIITGHVYEVDEYDFKNGSVTLENGLEVEELSKDRAKAIVTGRTPS